jgi:hypothetical protein
MLGTHRLQQWKLSRSLTPISGTNQNTERLETASHDSLTSMSLTSKSM